MAILQDRCRELGVTLGLEFETDAGWFQAHAYQFDEEMSTFIVEAPWKVWERAGIQKERAVEVLKLQNAARNSTEWFEHVDRYASLAPERWFAQQADLDAPSDRPAPPALLTPYTVRGVTLPNRVVVSPMVQYTALNDGTPSDWHFVHLGARAAGGAGLVMTEMTCVSPDARITPWCPGMWNDEHRDTLARTRALRARRCEGCDEEDVERDRPAAARGRVAADRAIGSAVPRGRLAGRAHDARCVASREAQSCASHSSSGKRRSSVSPAPRISVPRNIAPPRRSSND